MQLIEISSFKLFCCKLDSHKMFCCKKFCHKNVVRKAKKFPARERKKLRAGRSRWPCRAAAPYGRGRSHGRGFVRAFLAFFFAFFFYFFF